MEVRLSANRHKDRFKSIMQLLQKRYSSEKHFLRFYLLSSLTISAATKMERIAKFSECRTFRYSLKRVWNHSGSKVLFIGLNPSKADESVDDPTIRRCIKFAKEWGFGGLCMVNLFAFCTPDPSDLLKVKDPIGPENDIILKKLIAESDEIVLVWGNNGSFLERNKKILKQIKNPRCLKVNKNGAPSHPLYLKGDLKPIPYSV